MDNGLCYIIKKIMCIWILVEYNVIPKLMEFTGVSTNMDTCNMKKGACRCRLSVHGK